MKVWIDITNSPHVLVFRPLIRILRERGAEVDVTAREYAQTLELLALHGIETTVVGRHGGASAAGKARAAAIAKSTKGVKSVVNTLTIGPKK
jgi:predicted glycosyltransferase